MNHSSHPFPQKHTTTIRNSWILRNHQTFPSFSHGVRTRQKQPAEDSGNMCQNLAVMWYIWYMVCDDDDFDDDNADHWCSPALAGWWSPPLPPTLGLVPGWNCLCICVYLCIFVFWFALSLSFICHYFCHCNCNYHQLINESSLCESMWYRVYLCSPGVWPDPKELSDDTFLYCCFEQFPV